jgi:hypothetical protein
VKHGIECGSFGKRKDIFVGVDWDAQTFYALKIEVSNAPPIDFKDLAGDAFLIEDGKNSIHPSKLSRVDAVLLAIEGFIHQLRVRGNVGTNRA